MRGHNLIGKKYTRLLVIELDKEKSSEMGKKYWKCSCNCDNKIIPVCQENLLTGNTKSCGCIREELRKERLRDPKLKYFTFLYFNIKKRCYNENNKNFKNYGGRGIIMQEDWINDKNKFIKDILDNLGHKPTTEHQLDRINNNGNYEINNLKWSTRKENARNKTSNRLLTYEGKTQNITAWAEEKNISYKLLSSRIKSNTPLEKLFLPKNTSIRSRDKIQILDGLWYGIKDRCFNKKCPNFSNYGGRGIKMQEDWINDKSKFIEDIIAEIGFRPSQDHQLDRIDNNGNYQLENLRWATRKENARNKSNNKKITINGENKTVSEWSEISGLNVHLIFKRLKYGWLDNELLLPISERKFDQKDIENIRNLYFTKRKTIIEISKIYECSTPTIVDIIHKRGAYKC